MSFTYKAVRRAPRQKAKERLVGHEWRCDDCCELVHEEPVIGNAGEETDEQAEARHGRVQAALNAHRCPPKKGDE